MDQTISKKILEIINGHISDPGFSTDKLADEIGLGRSQLHRKLVSLIGPNVENLASDPLQVTLQIQKESMQRQSDSFKTAIEGAISEATAPNVLSRVAGFGLIAAGIATTLLTGGVAAGAGIAAVGAGAMMLGEADSNKRKAVNVKLAAAAVELVVPI